MLGLCWLVSAGQFMCANTHWFTHCIGSHVWISWIGFAGDSQDAWIVLNCYIAITLHYITITRCLDYVELLVPVYLCARSVRLSTHRPSAPCPSSSAFDLPSTNTNTRANTREIQEYYKRNTRKFVLIFIQVTNTIHTKFYFSPPCVFNCLLKVLVCSQT